MGDKGNNNLGLAIASAFSITIVGIGAVYTWQYLGWWTIAVALIFIAVIMAGLAIISSQKSWTQPLNNALIPDTINAPIIGPHSEPLPPTATHTRICMDMPIPITEGVIVETVTYKAPAIPAIAHEIAKIIVLNKFTL